MKENNALVLVKDMKETDFALATVSGAKLALEMNCIKLMAEKNPTVPKDQFIDFLYKAQITGADPRLGQIHLIPFDKKYTDDDGRTWKTKVEASVVFNYLFLIQKAEETGKLDGFESGVKNLDKPMKQWIGWAKVYRKDFKQPVYVECLFGEFAKMNKKGELVKQWLTMPAYMLEKCALANAIRRAFPSLAGIFIDEEMVHEEVKIKDVTPPVAPVQEKKKAEPIVHSDEVNAHEQPPAPVKEKKTAPPAEKKPNGDAFKKASDAIKNAKSNTDLKSILGRIEASNFSKKEVEELKDQYYQKSERLAIQTEEFTEQEPPDFSEADVPDFGEEK